MSRRNGIDIGTTTHTGYVREENQDYQGVFETPLGLLLVVADGMGGYRGGALAAQLTVQELHKTFSGSNPEQPVEEAIQEAFSNANSQVYRRATAGDGKTEGMGSTAVILLLSGNRAWIAHVGDSRAYLLRGGRMTRLTKDHTRVQHMVDVGILTEEEARVHPDGNLLDRAMGQMPAVEMDLDIHRLTAGDAVLLCTDGLWAYATETEIERVLSRPGTAQQLCEQLVKLALEHGGEDNITVQLLRTGVTMEAAEHARGRGTRELPQEVPTATPNSDPSERRFLYFTVITTIAILAGIVLWLHHQSLQAPHQTANVPTPAAGTVSRRPADKADTDVEGPPGAQQGQAGDRSTPVAETTTPDAKGSADTNQLPAGGAAQLPADTGGVDPRTRSGEAKQEQMSPGKPPPTDTPTSGVDRAEMRRDPQQSPLTSGAAGTPTPKSPDNREEPEKDLESSQTAAPAGAPR